MNKLITTALTAAALVAAPSAAFAQEYQAHDANLLGFPAAVLVGPELHPDYITWSGPKGTEDITAMCLPNGAYTWEARGPHTGELVDAAARSWCGQVYPQ